MKIYDCIIIGAGPAGITATVYLARKRIDFLVITKDIGGQAAISGDIENYTGYQFITGPELSAKFEEHMRNYSFDLKEQEEASIVVKRDDGVIAVKTDKGEYQARSAIIASGKKPKELNVPGEKEFKNKGVSYCATCDGPLFAGKDVAIIGGGNSALDAGLQLIRIAKRVFIINNTPKLGGDSVMREQIESSKVATVLNNSKVAAIFGDNFVLGIKVDKEGKEETLAVQGVFVEAGLIPNTDFISIVEKNAFKEINVNGHNETNVPGIFAAGDVTNVPEKQIVIAAGEGAKAALSTFKYLMQNR
jgi:alkyl hydroperoxide reductase subunit F